jgi:uncharacterized membrane protein
MEMMRVEELVRTAVDYLRLGVEVVGATIIAVGVVVALFHLVIIATRRTTRDFHGVRLLLARHLALALEFQLAADILSTAVAPSWEAIGKLAAIAVIRTGLNFFLMREMEEEGGGKRGASSA